MTVSCNIVNEYKNNRRVYIEVHDINELYGNLDGVINVVIQYMKKHNTNNPPIQVVIVHKYGSRGTEINTLTELLKYGNKSHKDQLNEVIYSQIEELRKSLF